MVHLCPTIGAFSDRCNSGHRLQNPAEVRLAHGSQSVPDGGAVGLIPIADQVARGLIPRETTMAHAAMVLRMIPFRARFGRPGSMFVCNTPGLSETRHSPGLTGLTG
jgi:hypothetical protein